MIDVLITRYYQDSCATLGILNIIDEEHLPIFTLENPWKDNTSNISCIPVGAYDVEPYNGTKFKDVYKLLNVPDRNNVLIHWGNYERQTKGCILLGSGVDVSLNEPMITKSKITMNRFRELVGKNDFRLTIKHGV